MPAMFLSLLLALQMMLCAAYPAAQPGKAESQPVFFGMIDPEAALWFARIPLFSEDEEEETILWDWSWRGFLASIFSQPLVKEEDSHGLSA